MGATGLQPLQQIESGKGHQDHESRRVEGVNDEKGGWDPREERWKMGAVGWGRARRQ